MQSFIIFTVELELRQEEKKEVHTPATVLVDMSLHANSSHLHSADLS
jgi:hypothetical protein